MTDSLWQLTLARWRMFVREPSAVFWTFGFPILLSIALGVAFRNRPPDPVIVAIEAGPSSEAMKQSLEAPDVKVQVLDAEAARHALRTGKASVVVVPGPPRTYRYDEMRPESRLARALVDDRLQRAEGRLDATPTVDEKVTEPGTRYIDFLLPGLIGVNILSSGMWGVGFLIVEMRTRKLIKRLVATPMKRGEFLLSFVAMRMLFLVVELPVLLVFGYIAFGVQMRGSYVTFFALVLTAALTFAGMGLLVASRAKNTQTVSGLINLVMMPMFIGSGVFFSSANFPDALQPVLRVLPLTILNDALRAVMNEGATLAMVATPMLGLAAWGVVSFALALRLFRWQ